MKKTIALILGVSLLSGTILSISFASREAYHAYLLSHNTRFSEGRTSQLKQALQQKRTKNSLEKTKAQVQNLRYSQQNTRNTYVRFSNNKNLKTRVSTNAVRYSKSSPLHRKAIIAYPIKNQNVAVQTYENDAFSLQIPVGWTNSTENSHIFTNPKNDFVISIKRITANTCSEITGFDACAISISKNENRLGLSGPGSLLPASRIVRQSSISDTFLNRSDLWTRTFTESFSAYVPQHGDQLINRYFVEDLDHGVYLIQTTSSVYFAKDNIKVSKKVFDSFRIYPKD